MLADTVEVARRRRHPQAHPHRGGGRRGHRRRGQPGHRAGHLVWLRNQLYQAIARGELAAVHIGRSIRIPKQALLDLLAAASPPTASGDE
jgi:excisionase family DNA binding protein